MFEFNDLFDSPLLRCKVKPEDVPDDAIFGSAPGLLDEEAGVKTESGFSSYLKKENLIISMIREKKKHIESFDPDEFLESLSDRMMQKGNDRQRFSYAKRLVQRNIVNPMLKRLGKELKEAEGDVSAVDFSPLTDLTGGKVCSMTSNEERMLQILLELSGTEREKAVGVVIEAPSGARYSLSLAGDLRQNYRKGGRVFRGARHKVYYNRDGESVAELYLKRKVSELFTEHCRKIAEEGMDWTKDIVYMSCMEHVRDVLQKYLNPTYPQFCVRNDYGKYRLPSVIRTLIPSILTELGYSYEVIADQEIADGRHGNRKAIDRYGVSCVCGIWAAFDPDILFSPYNEERQTAGFSWTDAESRQEYEASRLLTILYTNYREIKQRERDMKELEKMSRADVYQTKKNIPEKYLEAMKASRFNSSFGFVEIDDDCELGLMPELEKEFLALKEDGFLKDQACAGIAIRFRKLHRYRADGLYFPGIRCLCVDVRNPSTFCHEAYHLIDYERGELSLKYDFLPIRKEYERILRSSLDKCPKDVRERLTGNSKYNLKYYLKPTEVFARCGEIYMTRIRHINNSLCRPQPGFEYPEAEGNDTLYRMVEEYYRNLFDYREDKEAEAS